MPHVAAFFWSMLADHGIEADPGQPRWRISICIAIRVLA
jgi:hypothetical protein